MLARRARATCSCSAASSAWRVSSRSAFGILERPLAGDRGDDLRQPRIALDQPAAEGDAVGLVDDAARTDEVEVAEHGLAHQVGVQRRNAVDLVRADEGEAAHPHAPAALLVNQRNGREQSGIAESALARGVEMGRVDQVDDLHVARQQPLHQRHRPALQRLGQERMVGVGEDLLGDLPRLLPVDAVEVDENAHQLGDGDRRMRVVELNRGVVGQGADVAELFDVATDEIEQRGRSEEIFLPQPQLLAGRGRVARIEHLGDRLGAHGVRKGADVVAGVEGVELQRVDGARRPQSQRIDVTTAPTDDRRVVADRLDRLVGVPDVTDGFFAVGDRFHPAAETDRVIDLGALEFPRIAVREPILGNLLLPAVADDLAEEAVVVTNAVSGRGDRQRRHAVHEAGGEAAEAAVAERGVGFQLPQMRQVETELRQRRRHRLDDAEIGDRVIEQTADQKFERQVIDALAAVAVDGVGRGDPAFDDDVAGGESDGEEPVARAGGDAVLADRVGQLGENRRFQLIRRVIAYGRQRREDRAGRLLVHVCSFPERRRMIVSNTDGNLLNVVG